MKNLPNVAHLPIDTVLADLEKALQDNSGAVLQAPPGAGKTTRVPLALLASPWLSGLKILLLSPRRLATRAAAQHMAGLLGQRVGETVGYRMRMESRISPATRIEAVTEGVLTRMLQTQSDLPGVGLVIFDEFHERSLDADLGLALCLDVQSALNPNLRILVMSATLDAEPVATMMGGVPVITCSGKSFPVTTHYLAEPFTPPLETAVAQMVLNALHNEEGSILVFLPGAKEIRGVLRRLQEKTLPPRIILAPLYGNLPRTAQQQAIAPAPDGCRKIVLASAIAETSLTIEGIRVVIDSGLARLPRHDPGSGMTRLITLPVSQASADQRRGRAGRTQPGVCHRMWTRALHPTLPPAHRPEIEEADLCPLMLNLALWGVTDYNDLNWLNPPPEGLVLSARELLIRLGAMDRSHRLTAQGRKTAELPIHPRLAAMLLGADGQAQRRTACDLAALLNERDPVNFPAGQRSADLRLRLDLLRRIRAGKAIHAKGITVDRGILQRAFAFSDHLLKLLDNVQPNQTRDDSSWPDTIGPLAALAYPDRIAQKRPRERGHFLLSSGRGALIDPEDPLADLEYLVALELDGARRNARIFLAAGYDGEMIAQQFQEGLDIVREIRWNSTQQRVAAQEKILLGALVIRQQNLSDPAPEAIRKAMLDGIAQAGIDCLPWRPAHHSFRARVAFLRRIFPDQQWPDLSDATLLETLEEWLGPYLDGMSRLKDLARLDLTGILKGLLDWPKLKSLDDLAPTQFRVPSGSNITIDYSASIPVLSVRLQELFGCKETPAVAGGRQRLILHLLSPARRPVQITQDLQGFWESSYVDVKKELKGRYPKHYWPDDPLAAPPTARAKPRKKS